MRDARTHIIPPKTYEKPHLALGSLKSVSKKDGRGLNIKVIRLGEREGRDCKSLTWPSL